LGIADQIFPAKTAEAIRSRIPQEIIEEVLGRTSEQSTASIVHPDA